VNAASPFARETSRDRQRNATRQKLYEAALAEFAREGFDAARVSDIARKAGMSRAAFYVHFPTKEHVLRELQWHKEVEVRERLAGCATLTEALGRLPDALVDALESIPGATVARDMIRIHAGARSLPDGLSSFPLVVELIRLFRLGAAAGELIPGLAPERAATLCLKGVFGYLMATEPTADRRDDVRVLVGLYLRAPSS